MLRIIERIIMVLIVLALLVLLMLDDAKAEVSMHAIAKIESNNNTNAVSFLGAKYGRGLYQISEIMLKDYNNAHKCNIKPVELFNSSINGKVANWAINERLPRLLRHYGVNPTDETVVQAFNLGAKAYADGKRNINYLNKYKEAL